MDIYQEWDLEPEWPTGQYPGATILADDGTQMTNYLPRAERMVALWNLFVGIPTESLVRLKREQIQELVDRLE